MTDNMKYWNEMAKPPLDALKPIKGGRLTGMTNISPQWRWKVMTEQFGMIGFGWKYTVEKRWTSPGANDEHFAFAEILLYVKVNDQWSEAIPGEGGSKLVQKEKGGLYNNDESFKMAVTDALGTAMAKLGVGADIYLGTFDGSKYNEPSGFPKTVNSSKDVKETLPSKDSVPIDEAFPPDGATAQAQELANGDKLTKKELLKGDNIKAIADAVEGMSAKQVVLHINKLEGESFSIKEIIDSITGDKNG